MIVLNLSFNSMDKDKAPAIGGAGGAVMAWIHDHMMLAVVPPFLAELLQVALYAFIGASIGEGVKMGYAWLKSKFKK